MTMLFATLNLQWLRRLALVWALTACLATAARAQGDEEPLEDDIEPTTTATLPLVDAWTTEALKVMAAVEANDGALGLALAEDFVNANNIMLDAMFLAGERLRASLTVADETLAARREALLAFEDALFTMQLPAQLFSGWLTRPDDPEETSETLAAFNENLPLVRAAAEKIDPVLIPLIGEPVPPYLKLDLYAGDQVRPGDPIQIRIHISNPGDAPVTGVELTLIDDARLGGDLYEFPIDDIPAHGLFVHLYNAQVPADFTAPYMQFYVGVKGANADEIGDSAIFEVIR